MSAAVNRVNTTSRGTVIALWVLRVLVGLAFLAAGAQKLTGAPAMVAIFEKVGLGQGFRIVTGLLEVIGAIGLFVPRLTSLAALLLMAIMAGAIVAHVTRLGTNPAPPIVLLILSAAIAYLARKAQPTR